MSKSPDDAASENKALSLDKERDKDRIVRALCQNAMVGDDKRLANRLLREGNLKPIAANTDLITQGANDDEVYFIIIGKFDIIIDGLKRDVRRSGQSVGELAAHTTEPRTATVRAIDDSAVLAFPGEAFRKLIDTKPEMQKGLAQITTAMLQERLADKIEFRNTSRQRWTIVSASIAAVVAVASYVLCIAQFGFGILASAGWALLASALAFFFSVINNPDYFYRMMTRLCVLSVLVYGGLGWVFTVNGVEVSLEQTGVSHPIAYIATLFGLILLAAFFAVLDKMRSN